MKNEVKCKYTQKCSCYENNAAGVIPKCLHCHHNKVKDNTKKNYYKPEHRGNFLLSSILFLSKVLIVIYISTCLLYYLLK